MLHFIGFTPDIQSLVQMLGACMIPGSPQANMYFTLYGYNTLQQARGIIRDLKMGQYTKLPPRVTFTVQAVGAVVVSCYKCCLLSSNCAIRVGWTP